MVKNNLNKNICEELFVEKIKVTVVPDCFEKSDARRQKNCLYRTLQIAMKRISTKNKMVQKNDKFWRVKKNMFLPIREGIAEVRDEDCQTAPQTVVSNSQDLRKRPWEPSVSPQDIAAKKPVTKRPKASKSEEARQIRKLGVTVQGIRETRYKDLLVELKCSKEGRGWLDTALKEVIGASGTVATSHPGSRSRSRT